MSMTNDLRVELLTKGLDQLSITTKDLQRLVTRTSPPSGYFALMATCGIETEVAGDRKAPPSLANVHLTRSKVDFHAFINSRMLVSDCNSTKTRANAKDASTAKP